MSSALTVIGGGPAGLAAATAAAEAGVATTLIDENEQLGGQYLRQPRGERPAGPGDRSARTGAAAIAALHEAGAEPLLGATAYTAAPGRVEVETERSGRTLRGGIVLAGGAVERVVPLPGWTLPGVVTCGAAQAMLKMHGEPVGRRVLVAGSGPFLLPVAAALIRAGVRVEMVAEAQRLGRRAVTAASSSPAVLGEAAGHLWALTTARTRLRTGLGVTRIEQRDGGLRVELARFDRGGDFDRRQSESVDCDAVCLSDGFIPAVDLGQLAGAGLRFLPGSRTWAIEADDDTGETAAPLVWAAGACVGPWSGARLSRVAGEAVGLHAASQLQGKPAPAPPPEIRKWRSLSRRLDRAFPTRPAWYRKTEDDVIVCRCENVDAGTIRAAASVSPDVNAVKRMTRAGMGLCQGRTCQASVAELTAATTGAPIESVCRFSARSPNRPTMLSTLASGLQRRDSGAPGA